MVVDIFRATTTMTTAFMHGAKGILPVASVEEAERLSANPDYIIAAERNVKRCDFAHLGNDPMEYDAETIQGREVVMTTTNGTKAINIAFEAGAKEVLIGSFLNLKSIVRYCQENQLEDLIILASGWQGQMASEDSLYAGALAYELEQAGVEVVFNDGTHLMQTIWEAHCLNLNTRLDYLSKSEHYARLEANGFAEAVPYCLTILSEDNLPVPVLREEEHAQRWLRI